LPLIALIVQVYIVEFVPTSSNWPLNRQTYFKSCTPHVTRGTDSVELAANFGFKPRLNERLFSLRPLHAKDYAKGNLAVITLVSTLMLSTDFIFPRRQDSRISIAYARC